MSETQYETPGNPDHYYTYSNHTTATQPDTQPQHTANDTAILQNIDNNAAANNEIGAPVVFSCGTCRSLLGDSYSWIDANTASILLGRCSNIVISNQLELATEGEDIGSTFNRIQCIQCSTSLGKIYRSTPPHLDEFRDRFALNVDKISGYELGTADNVSTKAIIASWISVNTKLMQLSVQQAKRINELESRQNELQSYVQTLDKRLSQLHHRVDGDSGEHRSKGDKSSKKHKLNDITNTTSHNGTSKPITVT